MDRNTITQPQEQASESARISLETRKLIFDIQMQEKQRTGTRPYVSDVIRDAVRFYHESKQEKVNV